MGLELILQCCDVVVEPAGRSPSATTSSERFAWEGDRADAAGLEPGDGSI